jgi:4'-phosphopantetheinyl transferase
LRTASRRVPISGEAGDVWLWAVPLDRAGGSMEWAFARLSPDERRHAGRFGDPVQRARYAIARAALRQLLGWYTERDPAGIRFAYGRAGKPRLEDTPVHFNVSHSGDLAVVALARNTTVGVDVERRKPSFRASDIASRLFHEEEKRQLTALPDNDLPGAVLRCWTMKEAVGKAIDLDLDQLLRDVIVDANPTAPPRLLRVGGSRAAEHWSVNQMSLVECRALVAVAAPVPEVHVEPIYRFHLPRASDSP